MYSEPTVSPNFVVRQKRKLFRNPLVIGGIFSIIVVVIVSVIALMSGNNTTSDPAPTAPNISARIVTETTPEVTSAEPTPEPDLVIPAEVVNVSQPTRNEGNATSSQTADLTPSCSIRASGDINVNIRSGPGMPFSLIGVLEARTTVDAIAISDNRWFEIENSDGTIGWVGGSVVDDIGDCGILPQVATPVCEVSNNTGNRVNIRAKANTNARIIRTLLTDDVLMADGQTADGWYRVLLNRELGWIHSDVVASSGGCSTLAVIAADEPEPQPVVNSDLAFTDEDCVVESFTGNTVDLHKTPDLTSAVVAKLNKAMKVSRMSTNGWYEIEGFGWAFGGELVTSGLCRLLPTVAPEQIRA